MAKKSSGTSSTSKGERANVSKATRRLMKDGVSEAEKMLNIQRAYWAGKNPWITMDNPNKEATHMKKIRRKANDLWGSPKERAKHPFILGGR